jgi:hypothetical protein
VHVQHLRNVFVLVGALAIWLVAMAFIFLGGATVLEQLGTDAPSFAGGEWGHYAVQVSVHTGLGFFVGLVIGVGVVSAQPIRWGVGAAVVMAVLHLGTTVDTWFFLIGVLRQAVEVSIAVLPSFACIGGCLVASRVVARRRIASAL